MISLIIGGRREDKEFSKLYNSLPKIKYLYLDAPGSLAEFSSRCVESAKKITHTNYLDEVIGSTKANDSIVLHLPILNEDNKYKVCAAVEVSLDLGLDIQIFVFGKTTVLFNWPDRWPPPKEVSV